MKIKFIKSNEKKKIINELNESFGINEIPYLLIESGKEKIRAYSGSLSKEEIMELNSELNIESIGLYVLRKEHSIRPSFDFPHLMKNQINKNIIEINKEQYENWIRGQDLEIETSPGIYLIKFDGLFVGIARSNSEKLLNHIPKDRRVKSQIIRK